MDLDAVLAQLRSEQEMLEEAILALERLATGGKRRGRPPKWLAEQKAVAVQKEPSPPKKKRVISDAARKRLAEAQRKRWAAARQANGQVT